MVVPGDDNDIMLTDIDRRVMNIKGDDEELEIEMQNVFKSYNLNREIKVDHGNLGIKSFTDNMKKEMIQREQLGKRENQDSTGLYGNYACIKR